MAADGSDAALVAAGAIPLSGGGDDHDAVLELVGDARFVLLGEASHGTEEFYAERARITRRLVEEKGFDAVAVEADWPDAHRVNRYVRAAGTDTSAEEALRGFRRFPTWMWRNTVVEEFVEWLRAHNSGRPAEDPGVGFYGLDLYSLYGSIEAVVDYLEGVDAEAAARARERYACFDQFGESEDYARAAAFGAGEHCQRAAIEQLVDLCAGAVEYAGRDDATAADDFYLAEQNARVVRNAEEYYRSMFGGRVSTWNLRDTHMVDTLDDLADHLGRRAGRPARVVVWAHNSHLGDARATEMGRWGELNVGQLVRERHLADAVNVGFTTATGTVSAADDWGGTVRRKAVRPPLAGSHEELLHQVDLPAFTVLLRPDGPAAEVLRRPRLERAIGVVYRPQSERTSHYFEARLSDQFDAVIHVDETQALRPLEVTGGWEGAEAPETYPSGL